MRRRRANRASGDRSPCGESRAAAADADSRFVVIPQGAGLVSRLRTALEQRPNDAWMILRQDHGSLSVDDGLLRSIAEQNPVTVAGRRVQDTCKQVIDGRVRRTIPRDSLVELRGPWIFTREALKRAVDASSQSFLKIETFADLCRVGQLRMRVVVID